MDGHYIERMELYLKFLNSALKSVVNHVIQIAEISLLADSFIFAGTYILIPDIDISSTWHSQPEIFSYNSFL